MKTINIVIAGLGGQGVLKASDILADAVFRQGLDVKKAEVHGMSQRGGSVSSDVRFGTQVLSPMVARGEADFLLVLEPTQHEPNAHMLREGGTLLLPGQIDESKLANKRSANVAMLGLLAAKLPMIEQANWVGAIKAALPEKLYEVNLEAFEMGRNAVV